MPKDRADTDLVASVRGGDLNAFSEIVSRYQQVVCAVAFSACGSHALSEDVAQETFVVAWKKISELEDSHRLRGWLCSIARNRARDILRKRRREVLKPDGESEDFPTTESDAPSPLQNAVSLEEEQRLWEALEAIPENYREPLVLFYRDGQSIAQVAEGLDLSVAAVKQRLSRGRSALRGSMEQVSSCLARTRPTKTFTAGVIAAIAAQSGMAQAASQGLAQASRTSTAPGKGGALGLGLPLLSLLAVFFSGMAAWLLFDLTPLPQSGHSGTRASSAALSPQHSGQLPIVTPLPHQEEYRIAGRVLNLFQQPAAGVTVSLGGDATRTATTDEGGFFSFSGVTSGSVSVQARSADGASRPAVLHVDSDDDSIVLQLIEGSTLQLSLIAKDQGTPLPGIEVQLRTGPIELSATTNEEGLAHFHGITTAESRAQIQAPGFAAVDLPIVLSGEPGIHKRRLSLLRGTPLAGTVKDAEGRPIADATIRLRGDFTSQRVAMTRSDAEGRWLLEAVANEKALLFVTHDDYLRNMVRLRPGVKSNSPETSLVMQQGKGARGRVVYPDGTPAVGARVFSKTTGKWAQADVNGAFHVAGLEPHVQRLWAEHQVYGSASVALEEENKDTTGLLLRLEDNSIRGVVRDADGAPVVGAQVRAIRSAKEHGEGRLDSAHNLTDARGEFTLGPLPADARFDLMAVMPDVAAAYLRLDPVEPVRAQSGTSGVELKLHQTGQLAGRVQGKDGKISDFAVVVAQYTEALEYEASSPFAETEGEFALGRVPQGRYSVAIVAEGYKPKIVEKVRVRAGRTTDLGRIKLVAGKNLRGKVVDEAGQPIANARVVSGSALDANSSSFMVIQTSINEGADPLAVRNTNILDVRTDAEGYFELRNLHTRRHGLYVAAEKPGVGRSVSVEVSRQKGELLLKLRRTATIKGNLLGVEGDEAIAVSAVRLIAGLPADESPLQLGTATNGKDFEFNSLTPGTYLFSAHSEDSGPDFFRSTKRVEVAGGEHKTIDLEVDLLDLPPWSDEAIDFYEEHVKALCACESQSCRQNEEEILGEIIGGHDGLTGPQFDRLRTLGKTRADCR
jgi:RNA polymerase sigma factor (sigma-70 family)